MKELCKKADKEKAFVYRKKEEEEEEYVAIVWFYIQVDYPGVRTFSLDYAIDLDKNGAKNNDCRYGQRNEVKRGETGERLELLVISLTLIFHHDV